MMEQDKERTSSTASKEEQKAEWTADQEAALMKLVPIQGTKDWARVADNFNVSFPQSQRTAKQCAAHWQEVQDNENAKKSWTEQDELAMLIAHKKHKNRWADVSEALNGRSNNTIKNKFYSVFRKIRGKILKGDCSYVSKLELLEIHYIIILIEQYLSNPAQTPKTKGKRGKDFIYSLIHSLTDKMVADYKAKIIELTKHEGTMDELFDKLAGEMQSPKVNDQPMSEPAAEPVPAPVPAEPAITPPVPVPVATPVMVTTPIVFSSASPAPQRPLKQEFAEPICPVRFMCEPVRIEEDRLLGTVPIPHEPVVDGSPLFNSMPPFSPSFLFSPNTLSVGPAGAAARAAKAACFGNSTADFSEVSTVMKSFNDKAGIEALHLPSSVKSTLRLPAMRWGDGLQPIQLPPSAQSVANNQPPHCDFTQGQ